MVEIFQYQANSKILNLETLSECVQKFHKSDIREIKATNG